MGHIHPRALYLDCLRDLSESVPDSVLRALERGEATEPWPDITHQQMAGLQLAKSFLKKFQGVSVSKTADRKALEKFLSVNQRAGNWSYEPRDSWDEVLFGELKRTVYDFFYPEGLPLVSDAWQIFNRLRVGPGASIGAAEGDIYSKMFSSTLTTTSKGLYRAYRSYTSGLPLWEDAEQFRYSGFGEPCVVSSNRLRFVPKNCDISRTICVEPVLNMSYQLGLGSIIEDRLRFFFGIDLSKQPDINRDLCLRGSVDDSFATIDLESASDSLSLRMLEAVFPRDSLAWFTVARSPNSELPDGRQVKLEMISTMGNGYTFPLQTCLFASIVAAAARARSFPLVRPRAASDGTYGVFGDDIIVPTGCHYVGDQFVNYSDTLVRDVLRLLRLCGFVVNSSKSFFEGPFRESCGVDAFMGLDVRGVYIKSLTSVQDRFASINALNDWTARTGIPLPRTIGQLLRTVPKRAVPLAEAADVGIRVPLSLLSRYRSDKLSGNVLYKAFEPVTKSYFINEEEVRHRRLKYNPSGLLLAFLHGTIRSGRVSVRRGTLLYRNRWRTTVWWDFPGYDQSRSRGCYTGWYPPTVSGPRPDGQPRIHVAVSLNIGRVTFEV